MDARPVCPGQHRGPKRDGWNLPRSGEALLPPPSVARAEHWHLRGMRSETHQVPTPCQA